MPKEILFEVPKLFSGELIVQTMQQVFVDILHEYVDFNNTTDVKTDDEPEDFVERASFSDVSQFLTKKPSIRPTTISRWFQFAHSAQRQSMDSFLEDQNQFAVKTNPTYKKFVCKPHYRNITAVHGVLRRIIREIDENSSLEASQRILDRSVNGRAKKCRSSAFRLGN